MARGSPTRRGWPHAMHAMALAAVLCSAPALADCKTDLVASQQELKATAAGVEQVAAAPEAGRCPAYRKRYAAMIKFREVLARCDTGKQRAEHVAQLDTSIEGLRTQMPGGCKP